MKRVGYLLEDIADADNLLNAFYKASRGKQMKEEVKLFSTSLDKNITKLRNSLLSGNIDVGHYTYFNIHDPKPRMICAASFHERVLHHAIMNICHPYFERNFIETTYATRPCKGIYKALERTKAALKKYKFVAKFDFRKYFDSINQDILKAKLQRLFKDRMLLNLFDLIIDSYHTQENKGVPIGNLTSQYFANYYLSSLDHRCREILRVDEYIRYMDDFLVFASTSAGLDYYIGDIQNYASSKLLLQLKPVIKTLATDGISFLGYRVYPDKILLNNQSKKRLNRKMQLYQLLLDNGEWSEKCYLEHITPLLAFAEYGYTKRLRRRILINENRHNSFNRVNRGGNWNNNASNCTVSNRNNNNPDNRNNNNGFRLAMLPRV